MSSNRQYEQQQVTATSATKADDESGRQMPGAAAEGMMAGYVIGNTAFVLTDTPPAPLGDESLAAPEVGMPATVPAVSNPVATDPVAMNAHANRTLATNTAITTSAATTSVAAESERVIIYHPAWNEVTGSMTASILLAQMLYWWTAMGRRPFYKFNAPCQAQAYREGDSWTEELGVSAKVFSRARRQIAVTGTPDMLDPAALVTYWKTRDNKTWYAVNEQMVVDKLGLAVAQRLGWTEYLPSVASASSPNASSVAETVPAMTAAPVVPAPPVHSHSHRGLATPPPPPPPNWSEDARLYLPVAPSAPSSPQEMAASAVPPVPEAVSDLQTVKVSTVTTEAGELVVDASVSSPSSPTLPKGDSPIDQRSIPNEQKVDSPIDQRGIRYTESTSEKNSNKTTNRTFAQKNEQKSN